MSPRSAQARRVPRDADAVRSLPRDAERTVRRRPRHMFTGGLDMTIPALGTGKLYAPNITPDKDTGIGAWTEDQMFTTLKTMVRPNGKMITPPMLMLQAGWSELDARPPRGRRTSISPRGEEQGPDSTFKLNATGGDPPPGDQGRRREARTCQAAATRQRLDDANDPVASSCPCAGRAGSRSVEIRQRDLLRDILHDDVVEIRAALRRSARAPCPSTSRARPGRADRRARCRPRARRAACRGRHRAGHRRRAADRSAS